MMTEFFHPELVRFAFVVGIVTSIALYERRQLTTGGIAVPGYLGFAVFLPQIAVASLLTALIVYGLVHVLLPRFVLMSKRVKFSLAIVVSALAHVAVRGALLNAQAADAASPFLLGMGYIVPGLIAHDFYRHGIGRTTVNIATASAIVAAAVLGAVLLFPAYGQMYPGAGSPALAFDLTWMPVAVLFSVIAWLGVARNRGLRCGGFVGGAYISLLVTQPAELLAFAVLAAVTLTLTRTVLEPNMVLFGRRKFAAVLLLGSTLSWLLFWFQEAWLGAATMTAMSPSLTAISVLLTGLLASDADRVGVQRTLLGVVANVSFTVAGTLLVIEALSAQRTEILMPLLAIMLVVGALLFAPIPALKPSTPHSQPSDDFL